MAKNHTLSDNALHRRHCMRIGAAALLVGALSGMHLDSHAQTPSPVIVVVGDSISAEYGLTKGQGWVPLLQKRLAQENITATVINASVSGDTSSGGRSRLPALLRQHQPSHVIIELGGNDALRGLALANTENNLTAMVQAAQASGAQVLLLGMQVPPNYGAAYTRQFQALFTQVAKTSRAALVPSIMQGIGDNTDNPIALFQADRIHPNAQAQSILLNNVWPALEPLLRSSKHEIKKPARR